MKKLVTVTLFSIFQAVLYSQQGNIKGGIFDKATNEPLAGATISLNQGNVAAVADKYGIFNIPNINIGRITFIVSHIGYEKQEITVNVISGKETYTTIIMNLNDQVADQIVIVASKRSEHIVNAPASIQVIGKKELDQFSGSNVFELYSKVQGLEFVRVGVDYIAINARGFNRAANNKVFQIVDGRNTMTTASIGLPLYNNASVNKEDIDRIEIVTGPQTALYGPNVTNALTYTFTKDPRRYPGTTVAVNTGNHSQFSTRLRHASIINDKWAFKLSGEYVTGKEFIFYDSVYVGNDSFYGPKQAIPERNVDFNFRHIRGEAHLFYKISTTADIIISGGGSENDFIGVTNAGRNQAKEISTGFMQARFVHPNFFATIYNSWGNLGSTYAIVPYTTDYWNRTHSTLPASDTMRGILTPDEAEINALRLGNRFKEKNQRINADAQYNYFFKNIGLFLITGLSYQKDKPNSFGYSLLDKENRIYVTQTGLVTQLEKSLPWQTKFIGAIRFDHHSTLGNFVSPKLGITKKFREHNLRLTWAKAYSVPSIFFQYANLNGRTFGNGSGIVYLPNGSSFSDQRLLTSPLVAEENRTWEIGYKAVVDKNLFLDISFYRGRNRNFLGPPLIVQGRAEFVNGIAVIQNPENAGTFDSTSGKLKNASFFTFFNYGDVKTYGIDAGLNYTFNKYISVALKYSWFDSDITKGYIGNDANNDGEVLEDERSFNAPRNRGVILLSLSNIYRQKVFLNFSARYTEAYDFYSGNQIGTESGKDSRGKIGEYLKNFNWGALGGFIIVDIGAGYKCSDMINLNVNITNLFNAKQLEFVGSPFIGRLVMAELKVQVPNRSKK